jgi:hypothetical protein
MNIDNITTMKTLNNGDKYTGEIAEPKKLTLSLIIHWIFGLFFALMFMGALIESSIIGAILMLIATIITLPLTAQAIEKAMNFSLSGALRFVVVLVLLAGAGMAMLVLLQK